MPLSTEIIEPITRPLEKVLKAGGILGLLVILLTVFLMVVIYQGQQRTNDGIQDLRAIAQNQLEAQNKTNEIMSDIRYTMKAQGGISFRNTEKQ